MRFLRRISTRRLLALCAAIIAVAAAGAAIALAAGGGAPTPLPKPLAQAIHDALGAPAVEGVTARIHFTNHLIDQSDLGEGADPLADLAPQPDGHLPRRAGDPPHPADVEERLVDRQALDERRRVVEDAVHGLAGVRVGRHARRDDDRSWAEP